MKKSWNPVLNLVLDIKNKYKEKNGELDTLTFETWLNKLSQFEDCMGLIKPFEILQVNQTSTLILIRFGVAEMQTMGDMLDNKDSIYRECRSVVIDLEKEELVITPFRKFFNLNEVEENMIDNVKKDIALAKRVEFSNKMDGSMQCATWYNGKVFMSGSMAIDPKNSYRLEEGYSMITKNHELMIKGNPSLTFIFEYISQRDRHVVVYDKSQEGLYLIGMRNKKNGNQYPYSAIKDFSTIYNIKATNTENITLEEALEKSKIHKSNEKEGWVINVDGKLIKLKCDDYILLHRTLDHISSINVIIKAIADNTYDDLISKIPLIYRARVEEIAKIVFEYVYKKNKKIEEIWSNIKNIGDKRKIVGHIQNNFDKEYKSFLICKYLGQEANVLKNMNGKYKKFNDIKEYLEKEGD